MTGLSKGDTNIAGAAGKNSVFTKISSTYTIENDILTIRIIMTFTPFDFTKYQWDFSSSAKTNNMVNWVNCILYNQIPFAICCTNGIYNSFDAEGADFQEIPWIFNDVNDNIKSLYTYIEEHGNKVIMGNPSLKDYAETFISKDPDWYVSNQLGKQFNFTYALNSCKFFNVGTCNNGTTITGFNALMKNIINGDQTTINNNISWVNVLNPNEQNEVTLTKKIDLSDIDGERTYAVISANPADHQIYTKFIYITNEVVPVKTTVLAYQENSLDYSVSNKKQHIKATVENSDSNVLTIKLENNDKKSNWKNEIPTISFRIKKTKI